MYDKNSIDEEAEREGNAIRGSFRGQRPPKKQRTQPNNIRQISTDHRTPQVDRLAMLNVINGVPTK